MGNIGQIIQFNTYTLNFIVNFIISLFSICSQFVQFINVILRSSIRKTDYGTEFC